MLIAAAAGYLAFMKVSHTTPFSPTLQVPLASGGWLIFVSQLIASWFTMPPGLRRRARGGRHGPRRGPWRVWRGIWRALRGRRDLALTGAVFAFLVGTAVVVGATGTVSYPCTSPATCSTKIDNWKAVDGSFYRQYPYDAAGNDDSSAPWVRISRAEYVAELGGLLRGAAGFGLASLVFGMLANLAAEAVASDPVAALGITFEPSRSNSGS